MADVKLEWKADDIFKMIDKATTSALNETVDDALKLARSSAPVDSGRLRESLKKSDLEKGKDTQEMSWGSDAIHAFIVEKLHPQKRGFMRKAQDSAAGHLAEKIKGKFNGT